MGGMEVWGPKVFSVSPCGKHADESWGLERKSFRHSLLDTHQEAHLGSKERFFRPLSTVLLMLLLTQREVISRSLT